MKLTKVELQLIQNALLGYEGFFDVYEFENLLAKVEYLLTDED